MKKVDIVNIMILIFKEGVEVGKKEFNIDTNDIMNSKSAGYMVGYIEGLGDQGYTVDIDNDKEILC